MSNNIREITEINKKLESSTGVLLVSHVKPDGDSIGSLLSLGLALKKIYNDKINMVCLDDIPKNFKFLSGLENVSKDINKINYDLIISLDCGDETRFSFDKYIFNKSSSIINIDHHISNTYYGDINIVDPNASSTAEIVYEIIKEMNIEVDVDIATALYVAISTDTGSFIYDNTSSKTHKIVSELIEKGIDVNKIVTNVYQSRSLQKTKLFIEGIKTLELLCEDRIAMVCIHNSLFSQTNTTKDDIDGIIEFIRDIETVEVACILREVSDNETKVGLRSKKYFDVSKLAKKFEGGGHVRAAGCTVHKDINESKKIIINQILHDLR